MALNPIPLFGLGNFGKSRNVSSQERVNLYAEIQQDPEAGSRLTFYPTPGKETFINLGAYPSRGVYRKDDVLYVVNHFTLWRIANDGSQTNVGTLSTGAGFVDISDNGTEILIVDGPNGYILDTGTNIFTQISDPGWEGADTCDFLNGVFIVTVPNSGRFKVSGLYDGMTWPALDFATAESNPDNLVRVLVDNGQAVLLGPDTTEFWSDSGALDFPLARVGAAAIEWGLAARWSLCKFMDSLIFLRKNRLGAVQVCTLSGYNAVPVSNPEMDFNLSKYSSVENATAYAYMVSGHPMYCISFPSENVSWTYDGLSNEWHKSESVGGRDRGELQINFLDNSYVTDYENGKLYRLQDDLYTDDGLPIVRQFITRHQATRRYSFLSELWLDMESGVGLLTGQGSDPQLMMQYSKDGGHTWSDEVWAEFGGIGEYGTRAVFRRLGRGRDFVFKFRVTDPVRTVFIGAWGVFS